MYAVGKLGSYISRGVVSVAAPFHPFGGAVDIVVVQQEDGSFKSSPWYVQFGKFQGVLKAREKVVSINVNGVDADFRMYLDSRGGAYFLRESDGDEGESGSWGDSAESMSSLRRPKKIMSCNYDLERSKLVSEFETGKVVTRSSSTGPRILGFVFGRSSGKENDSQREDAIGRERESSLERAEMAADLLEVKWSTSLATRKQKKGSISSNSDQQSSPNGNIQTSASVNNATGSKPDSSTPPHPNGDINYEDKFERSEEQASDAGCKTKVVEPSADCEISVDGSNGATDDLHFACSVSGKTDDHNLTSEVKPEISSSILSSETDKNVENIEDKNPCISVDGPKSDAVTPDDVETVLETKLKVTIERGPVKVVEEVIVDQVASDQEPSIPSDLLIEEATTAALDLMDNLTLEKHVISPHSDSLVTNGAVSETSEKFLSSDHAHFAFSDLDESEARSTGSTTATPLDSPEAGNSLQSFTGEVIQESLPNDHSSSLEISRTASNPVNIAGTRQQSDQIAQTVDSFSSSWSHGVDMNPQDVNQSISRSLDSSFDNMLLVQGDVPKVPEKGTHEQQSTPRKSSLEQYQNSDELRKLLSDPAVEISLCRHLLHEGMGYEAAAQTFDTEKVEVEKFVSLGPDVIKNDKVVVRIGGLYFPWDAALPIVSAIGAPRGEQILEPKGMIIVDKVENTSQGDPQQSTDAGNGTWSLWPSKKTKSMDRRNSVVTDATCSQRSPAGNLDTLESDTMKKKLVRAKTPTSEQLASLNLREGKNEVTFTFSTSMLGEQKVDAQIYLWKYNARIVISDVDGTITKSDVLGQFMPMVGVDWSQTGVTHLFSAIKENGYELLFLSARAISQASITRQFLFNLKQDGKALPPGPVVISPDGLFPSLFREVIRRAPHEFKIACLEDIKALFPLDYNPFYAGFGNRDTDEVSYVKVGIPKGKIFIINPKGEVAVHRRVDTKSYTSLHTLVHEMFPHPDTVPPDEQEDFNSWNFWRLSPHMG